MDDYHQTCKEVATVIFLGNEYLNLLHRCLPKQNFTCKGFFSSKKKEALRDLRIEELL